MSLKFIGKEPNDLSRQIINIRKELIMKKRKLTLTTKPAGWKGYGTGYR
jgi:hypothetical protein